MQKPLSPRDKVVIIQQKDKVEVNLWLPHESERTGRPGLTSVKSNVVLRAREKGWIEDFTLVRTAP